MNPRSVDLLAWTSIGIESALVVTAGAGTSAPNLAPLGAEGTFAVTTMTVDAARPLMLSVVHSTGSRHLADGLRVRNGNRTEDWERDELAGLRVEPEELLADHLVALDEPTRVATLEFLVEAMATGSGGGGAASRVLHLCREALRPRRPRAVVEGDGRLGGVVESLIRVDEHTCYVRGWFGWEPSDLRRVTAISPEGERVDVTAALHRYRRADVDAFYRRTPFTGAGAGVAALFTTVGESRLDRGWLIEVESADGTFVELPAPDATSELGPARDALISELALDGTDHALCERHISPAIERLAERRRKSVNIDVVVQHGVGAPDPIATVLVPIYRRLDLMEYQLAQFSIDPEMADVDLVYVLDSPDQADELCAAAARWFRLYRLPFRLAVLTGNGGFSLANNLGAGLARARDLILCNSDVIPERSGWVGSLLAARERAAAHLGGHQHVGAVGPMLLYEDDSLQHAGMYFDRPSPDVEWCNEHYFKGMHRSFPPANRSRAVASVTGACLLVDLERYLAVGGLSLSYVQGDFEDSDLCLRLAQDGGRSWYAAEVALYHLEGGSYPAGDRSRFGVYNRWLHQRRWGTTIDDLTNSGQFTPDAAAVPTVDLGPSREVGLR